MDSKEVIEQAVYGRIDAILVRNRQQDDRRYKELEDFLEPLEPETRKALEQYSEKLAEWSSGEMSAVYQQAFLDGLCLAHKAFETL